MLETLNQTNIGSLNLEEPKTKTELPFGMTEQDWDNMTEFCNDGSRPNLLIPDFQVILATSMKILFPDRRQPNLDKSPRVWEFLEKHIKDIRSELKKPERFNPNSTTMGDFCAYMLAAKTLFPNRLNFWDREHNWLALQPFLEGYGYYFGEEGRSLEPAFKLKMVYPEKQFPVMSEKYLEFVIEKTNRLRNKIVFAREVSFIKVLFPKIAGGFEIDESYWQEFRTHLEGLRQGNFGITYVDFIENIMAMKILAAEKVTVTERGLEFIMPGEETFNSKVPALPEVRKF